MCESGDVSLDDSPHADLRPGNERIALTQRLDEERNAIVTKLADLTDDEAAAQPIVSTNLTIGGIVKHLAHTEDRWFQHKFLGRPVGEPWASSPVETDPDWAFRSAGGQTVAELTDLYLDACARSRTVVANSASLDESAVLPSFGVGSVNLRWLLAHMIDETARHCGHIDLLRDSLDRPPVQS